MKKNTDCSHNPHVIATFAVTAFLVGVLLGTVVFPSFGANGLATTLTKSEPTTLTKTVAPSEGGSTTKEIRPPVTCYCSGKVVRDMRCGCSIVSSFGDVKGVSGSNCDVKGFPGYAYYPGINLGACGSTTVSSVSLPASCTDCKAACTKYLLTQSPDMSACKTPYGYSACSFDPVRIVAPPDMEAVCA